MQWCTYVAYFFRESRLLATEAHFLPLAGPWTWTRRRGSCSIARMRTAKAGGRGPGSGVKGKGAAKSVDEYLARVPEPARSTLNKIRAAIRSAAPAEATEVISYGIPAFKHKRVLVWFCLLYTSRCV